MAFKATRERTQRGLADMKDADFDTPAGAPEEFRHLLPTVGHCFMHALMHNSVHIGQLTDARRALGREPLLFNPKRVEAGAR